MATYEFVLLWITDVSDRQKGGKESQAKCGFPGFFYSPSHVLTSQPLQDHPSFPEYPSWYISRLLVVAYYAVHFICFLFCTETDFSFADFVSGAQAQGRIPAQGTNHFLCSLAGLGQAAARPLVSYKAVLATMEPCVWPVGAGHGPDLLKGWAVPDALPALGPWKMTFPMRKKTSLCFSRVVFGW